MNPIHVLAWYVVYWVLCLTLLGWSVLVTAVAPQRPRRAHAALIRRPLLCWLLGFLQLLAVLIMQRAPQGPLNLVKLLAIGITFAQLIVGLAACLARLGDAVAQLAGRRLRALGQLAAGGAVLFLAGGLPFVGQLLLLMTAFSCVGAVSLGMRMEPVVESDD